MIMIPILVMVLSSIVLTGWSLNIISLTTLGMGGVTEKAFTASMFLVASVGLLLVRYASANYFFAALLGFLAFLSLLATPPFSANDIPTYTVFLGVPSLGTIFVFSIVAYYLLMRAAHFKSSKALGKVIVTVCGFAIIGHLLEQPHMYYYANDISTGMAKSTAIKGTLIGAYIYSLGVIDNRYREII